MTNQHNLSPTDQPIVVGVGASAGGLEAFQQFLVGLPDDHGMVIVLIQHLDPEYNSLMPELVAAKTKSPVHSAKDKMSVDAGSIYLIPPGFDMEIKDGCLMLEKIATPRGVRRPIDRFFKSLAIDAGERAVAVVLSGTGSDGADGAREIKGLGGLVFVQDPEQAKYDGMPQSVLDRGCADVVSKAEEIIEVIRDYFNLRSSGKDDEPNEAQFLARIMRHVRYRTGHDFNDYKIGTMLRRVAVRMSVLGLAEHGDYLRYIAEHKEEADLLFHDLLINVTSFFRDTDHFEKLKTVVIPEIVEQCEEHGEVRIWIAGCSTGEEAYSVGMLFAEEVSRTDRNCRIIIFGTDIDQAALKQARAGHYPETITNAIPDAYLDRYFRSRNDGYEIGPELREMVRFSQHSMIKDPPFSKLDLVCCRNVLIYFNDKLQETAVKVFHYALREKGFLFIGPSENPKTVGEYFEEVEGRSRILQRRPGIAKALNLAGLTGSSLQTIAPSRDTPPNLPATTQVEQSLLELHSPPYFHVDRNDNIIFMSDNVTRFVQMRGGKMSNAINALIAPELESIVRRIMRIGAAVGSREEREYQGDLNGQPERLVLSADRLADGTVLVVIRDRLDIQRARAGGGNADEESNSYIQQLENELDEAKQAVRSTVEELETSNEELKSSNEEMMSMNEELQSANEELTTINDELQEKLRELAQSNADLRNYTASAEIATVFLDGDLNLRRFTPEAAQYFSFTESDIGRPFADLSSTLDQAKLIELCNQALSRDAPATHEFTNNSESKSLMCRIRSYSPDGPGGLGVVFTLQDVTEIRQALDSAQEMKALADQRANEVEQIYDNSPMAMGLIDENFRYVRLNEQLALLAGESLEDHLGSTIREVVPDAADEAEDVVRQVFETGQPIRGVRIEGATKSDPTNVHIWESDWVPHYQGGKIVAVAVTARDISDHVNMANNLRRIMQELEHRVKNMLANVGALVNQARREVTSNRDVYDKLTKRIQGLSKTHALLTAEKWSSANLRSIIAPETTAVYGEERVTLSGPEINVNSQATLSIGMTIHELATNAAKYGAFSTEVGHVSISWSRVNDASGDRLILEWKEEGGPTIQKPETIGFGSQLISSTVGGSLGGEVEYLWEPDGLQFVVRLNYEGVTSEDVIDAKNR